MFFIIYTDSICIYIHNLYMHQIREARGHVQFSVNVILTLNWLTYILTRIHLHTFLFGSFADGHNWLELREILVIPLILEFCRCLEYTLKKILVIPLIWELCRCQEYTLRELVVLLYIHSQCQNLQENFNFGRYI